MEHARLWVPITALGLTLAGFFCYSYFEKVDKANALFQTAKLITQQAQDSVDVRLRMLEARKRTAKEHATLRQKLQTDEVRLRAAADMIVSLNAKHQQMAAEVGQYIDWLTKSRTKFRNEFQGSQLSELSLARGKVLKSAQIRKIDKDSILVVHADGISSVAAADLPADLISKLGLGSNSLLSRLQQFHSSLSSAVNVAVSAKTDTANTFVAATSSRLTHPATAQNRMTLADESRLDALKRRQTELQTRLMDTRQNELISRQAMTDLSNQINIQKSRGVPTTRLKEQYQQTKVEADIAAASIQSLAMELGNIALEISQMSGKSRF